MAERSRLLPSLPKYTAEAQRQVLPYEPVCALFRRYLDRSPKRYYLELRLKKARSLLLAQASDWPFLRAPERVDYGPLVELVKLLAAAGLTVADLTVDTHGEFNLQVKTADETPEPRNRRVEITIR